MTKTARTLNSWKEIASYMDRGVRTVQRWHNTLRLPVHRISSAGGKKNPVFAYPEELDLWMRRHAQQDLDKQAAANRAMFKSSPTLRNASKVLEDQFEKTRQNQFQFMDTDLDAALTLIRIAEGASDIRKRTRNEANARRALETILALYRSSVLTEDERKDLDAKIAELRAALERLPLVQLKNQNLRAMR